MKDKDGFYIGRDSQGLFKWNEKRLIRIEEPKIKQPKTKKKMNNLTANNQQGYNTIIVSLLSDEAVETPKRKNRELYKTPAQIKDAKIEEIKQRRKLNILPDGNIPNSRVARMLDKLDAEATLEYAKSLNRPVRRAHAGECQAYFELQQKATTEVKTLLTPREAAILLNMFTKRFNILVEKFGLQPAKSHGKNKLYNRSDIEQFQRKHGPFYLD
ncbi:hypothetical protein [Chryseobacterium proteolyticum]|uniref:hypothetical protein n=1 Tax=Chryseobacterium proteolyticum TaxID=118127 RepID=UPI003983C7A7